MNAENDFISIAGLICEPSRAKMLWSLLDGRAYTATELAIAADISTTSASNHLAKLLESNILKVEIQGRNRYYSFAGAEVAYAIESLANLAVKDSSLKKKDPMATGVKKCRTCYDHLAGFVAVEIVEAFEQKDFLQKTETAYSVTKKGWEWFSNLEIFESDFTGNRRPITRQCLDWSERRPHLAGQLGAAFLEKTLSKKWFRKIQFSRELIITRKGRKEMLEMLDLNFT